MIDLIGCHPQSEGRAHQPLLNPMASMKPVSLIEALALSVQQLSDPAIVRVLVKSALITLVIAGLLGWGLWSLASAGFAAWLPASAAEEAGNQSALSALSDALSALAGFLALVIGGWLLFRLVALAVIQFFADEVVRAVEERHYAGHARVASLPLGQEIRSTAKSIARALGANLLALPLALLLIWTGIGAAAVFWLVNAVLLGRELQDLVWLRHAYHAAGSSDHDIPAGIAPISPLTRLSLGGIIAGMMAVPIVNFLAPVIGAAAATHLVHRTRP